MKIEDYDAEVNDIELSLLLEGIYQRYGYDFRDYARASVTRRMAQFMQDKFMQDNSNSSLLDITGRLLRDPDYFYRLIPYFSVSVTALFRDPHFYAALREKVIPMLRTWPNFKIWHAGCATGEEVYSMAILLQEQGILPRAQLYATDISQAALDTAKAGIYSLDTMRKGSANYHQAHGGNTLSDHYHVRYNAAAMNAQLRRRITFAQHNLVTDKVFGEMQLVICRNVLIYFNENLQNRVLELLWESLDYGGVLCLGDKETLAFSPIVERFQVIDKHNHIYKKAV